MMLLLGNRKFLFMYEQTVVYSTFVASEECGLASQCSALAEKPVFGTLSGTGKMELEQCLIIYYMLSSPHALDRNLCWSNR